MSEFERLYGGSVSDLGKGVNIWGDQVACGVLCESVDNMVDIHYKNPEVAEHCNPESSEFGVVPENRKVLIKQLQRLEKAITLAELKDKKELRGLRDKSGNFHSLEGNRAGQLAGALHGGWRLVFVPKHDPTPVDANGNLDWSKVTAVEIQEIWDYHNDPEYLLWKKENMK